MTRTGGLPLRSTAVESSPPGSLGILPLAAPRIICCTILNCLSRPFTSWVVTPLPCAMRIRREPLMSDGSRRSAGVIEQMIASMRAISPSSISASFSSLGIPGSIPMMFWIGPIFLTWRIWSRKSSSVSCPLRSFCSVCSISSWSKVASAFSISVSTSPIPRMRLAIRSGWNGSKSSSFSPVPAKRIGFPTTSFTESAAPPRASPSILVSTTPVSPTASSNSVATFTAS